MDKCARLFGSRPVVKLMIGIIWSVIDASNRWSRRFNFSRRGTALWRALGAEHGPWTERRRPGPHPVAMTWRRSFRPLRPEFDKFLFATVGGEIDGIPLSVASGLTRLGLDPWEEAGRLSSLSSREAVEQLARLIAEVPGSFRSLKEARVLADGLVGLLPNHDPSRTSAPQVQIRPRYEAPALLKPSQFWIACLVLAAAALVSAVVHGGLSFGIGSP